MPGPPTLPGGKFADISPWRPPPAPLTPDELQHGVHAPPKVADELARDPAPLVEALQQWSALPALSHFLAASVRVRELLHRLNEPHSFRPPPRVTLTDQRRGHWLEQLADPRSALRKLARAVPHGLSGRALLEAIQAAHVPMPRALWFVRCVGTNELRAVRRRGGSADQWLTEWTAEVIAWLQANVDRYPNPDWAISMQTTARMVSHLVYERLVNRKQVITWLLKQASAGTPLEPAYEHIVHALWPFCAPDALVAAAARTQSAKLVVRLAEDHEEALISPLHWPRIAPVLREVAPAVYDRVADRVNVFLVDVAADPHALPPEWTAATNVGQILDTFTTPYKFGELVSSLHVAASGRPPGLIVSAIMLWAVRRGDPSSVQLCLALLRRLARAGVSVEEHLVRFLMSPDVMATACLFDIIAETHRAGLLSLELYLYQLTASGKLYSEKYADRQRRILRNLPLCMMRPSLRAQALMLLKEREPTDSVAEIHAPAFRAMLEHGAPAPPGLEDELMRTRTKNERLLVVRKMVLLHRELQPQSVAVLQPFITLLDRAAGGSIAPLYHVLATTLSSATTEEVASFAVRQVQIRLLTFVCAGLLDSFAGRLLEKTRELGNPPVLLECFVVLQPVVRSPALLFELTRILSERSKPVHEDRNPLTAPPSAESNTKPGPSSTAPNGMVPSAAVTLSGSALTPNETTFETQLLAALSDSTPDVAALIDLKQDKEPAHQTLFAQGLIAWIRAHCTDRGSVIQLVLYKLVTIAAIDAHLQDDQLVLVLLLVPPNQIGLHFEEIAQVEDCRREYLETAPLPRLLDLLAEAAQDVERPRIARVAATFPDVYIDRIVRPSLRDPELLDKLRRVTTSSRSFAELLGRCNPFNLKYYQGMVLVALSGQSPQDAALSVLDGARSHPDKCAALRNLLVYVDPTIRRHTLIGAMRAFLTSPEMPPHAVKAYLTLLSTLGDDRIDVDGRSFTDDVQTGMRRFVDCAMANPDNEDLVPALICLIKVSILAPSTVSWIAVGLEELKRLPFFDTSYRVRTVVQDALRYFAQQSEDQTTEAASTSNDESKPGQPTQNAQGQPAETLPYRGLSSVPIEVYETSMDDVMLYSRSNDVYRPLNVSPFDLIEDAGAAPGLNDGPLDLCRFETYVVPEAD